MNYLFKKLQGSNLFEDLSLNKAPSSNRLAEVDRKYIR